MKKYLQNILMVGVLVSTFTIYPSYVKTPETLAIWLKEFTYQDDAEDYWKSPEETVKDKGGDCEDSVFVVGYVLDKLDYTNYPLAVTFDNRNTSHSINIVKINNEYTMFSNFKYYDTSFTTLRSLLNNYYPHWEKFYLISQKFPHKGLLIGER